MMKKRVLLFFKILIANRYTKENEIFPAITTTRIF